MQEVKTYRIFGLCRSGNHGIIGWLINKFDNKVIHHNNIIFNPKKKKFVGTEAPRIYRNTLPLDALIYSYEDYDYEKYFTEYCKYQEQTKDINIFIVRDAYNLFASRNKKALQSQHKRLKVTPEFARLWKVFIKEAYGETSFTNNKTVINYNQWVKSKEYREEISKKLNVCQEKDNVNILTNDGNGSSFDGFKYKENPQKMDVLNRWKHFENDKNFMSIFDDEELVELSQKYFGITHENN